MKRYRHYQLIWTSAFVLALLFSLLSPSSARADVAPPEQPPGTNIVPGTESTQVRMLAETVTMTVLAKPAGKRIGQAKTEAVFMMRNLGAAEEKMEVRFPLTFWNNESDGFGNFPEIPDIQIKVDGKIISTHRTESDYVNPGGGIAFSRAPWAAFDVTFPPGKDVIITVTYTANGYGYEPYFALRYILETGAGWNGTIGSADIIVKLPYEANPKNVMLEETTGFSDTTPGARFIGSEVRWHFEDFEPTAESNIEVSLVQPSLWQKVLDETAKVTKNPQDGEAWGRLGKAYKEIVRLPKYYRIDSGGQDAYQLSVQAYEKAVMLLPKDALWHYGFADLLWTHYYIYQFVGTDARDFSELTRAANEIRQSLALDLKNQNAKELASWMASQYPWAVSETDKGYDFLILTATPTFAPPTFTSLPEPSSTPEPSATLAPTAVSVTEPPPGRTPTPEPTPVSPNIPFCGGTALLLPLFAGMLWFFSKRR